jgi:hypothetical protein
MPKFATLMFLIILGGCTTANTVYLYDDASETAKIVNDIPVWEDAASAQTSVRGAAIRNWSDMKCQVRRLPAGAERKRNVGKAVEVTVHGGCTGFVNSAYVHAGK